MEALAVLVVAVIDSDGEVIRHGEVESHHARHSLEAPAHSLLRDEVLGDAQRHPRLHVAGHEDVQKLRLELYHLVGVIEGSLVLLAVELVVYGDTDVGVALVPHRRQADVLVVHLPRIRLEDVGELSIVVYLAQERFLGVVKLDLEGTSHHTAGGGDDDRQRLAPRSH